MEVHHRTEVGRATFLVGQQRVVIIDVTIPIRTRPLLAYILVSRCVLHVLTQPNRWLFRWHKVSILVPE